MIALFIQTNQANAQAVSRPDVDPYAVCMFRQAGYHGEPLCIDYADIRQVQNTGRVGSITIPQSTYVELCDRPRFDGDCHPIFRDIPDLYDTNIRTVEHGSLLMIPFSRAPQVLGRDFPSQVPAGNTFAFNPDHAQTGRPDFEVFNSEQGLAIRPINGAKMYLHMGQTPGLTGHHVMSCMAQHLMPGNAARYALAGQVLPGRRICIFTNQGRYALLTVRQDNRPNYFAFNWAVTGY